MSRIDPKLPTITQLPTVLAELREALSQLEEGGVIVEYDERGNASTRRTPPLSEVFVLLSLAAGDGFRASSRLGGSKAPVVDDEGFQMPPVSDPTGERAIGGIQIHDPIKGHAESALWALVDAQGKLRKAKTELIRAFEESDFSDIEPACLPHAEAGIYVLPTRGSRCSWCYRFWLAERRDPPPELIRLKDRVGRVTDKDIAEAFKPPITKTPGRKKVKRRRPPKAA